MRARSPSHVPERVALLVVWAALCAPVARARPEPPTDSGLLSETVLADPDLLPPDLLQPEPRFLGFLPRRPTLTTDREGLHIDWDGDGHADATVRAGKTVVLRAPREGGTVPVLATERDGSWRLGPAALLEGKVGDVPVALLDADLAGRFAVPAVFVRWAGGAFHRPTAEHRLPTSRGLARWALAREGQAWRFTLTPEPLPEGTTPAEVAGLLAANDFRNRVGLPPLALSRFWSAGCQKHAEYILLQPVEGFGHEEVPGRPGYSDEGRTAAQEGVMERTGDPANAVARLTRMLMHRTPFLCDPMFGLGVGAVSGGGTAGRDGSMGAPGFSVLRAGPALRSTSFPVVVPGAGQRDVPLTLLPEVPTPDRHPDLYTRPRGYAVSVSFLTSPQPRGSPRLTLRALSAHPQPLPGVVFTPAEPIHTSFAHNFATAFFVPDEPLSPGTTYEATAFWEGNPSLVWRFTTVKR